MSVRCPGALDLTDDAQISEVVAAAGARFGRLDIVVNNAGFAAFRSLDDPDYGDTSDRSLAVHVTAPMHIVLRSQVGLAGLTRSLADDLGRDGITVNCICPGASIPR